MTAELDYFISRYQRHDRSSGARPPDLDDSLAELSRIHAGLGTRGRLPRSCRCLIQGYAAPRNARSLRSYLISRGVDPAEIIAVDLYDLPSTYARLGCELPPLRFEQADARNLQGVLDDHCIDLVVQDFLVNCMPPGDIAALFREVSRVLSADGLAFVSFTDDQCMADEDPASSSRCPLPEGLWNEVMAAGRESRCSGIVGRRFHDLQTGSWAFVTPPYGRLEFFSPLSHTLSEMDAAGLEVLARTVSCGEDDHRLRCVRHRCILRRAGSEDSPP
jgi:hypothetical protein